MSALDVLVLGDAKPDLVVAGGVEVSLGRGERLVESAHLSLGGSGGVAASQLARLGLRVAFAGVVGDDAFGRFVADELEARGVDTRALVVDASVETGVSLVLQGTDREAVLTAIGSVGVAASRAVDRDLIAEARHVHVPSFYLQHALRPMVRDVFSTVRDRGGSTSIDPNRDPTGRWDGLLDLLSLTDVLFANSEEIRELTGMDDVDVAAEALAERGAVVAVKFALGGGLAMWGDEIVRSEALPADVVDTTGSGASFAAGFIAGRLEGWSIDRCLALAVSCASLSARAVGGVAAQPTMDEAVAALGTTA